MMKLFVGLIFIGIIIVIAQPILPSSVSTIDELVEMNDAERCKKCHEVVAPTWGKSKHATPLKNIIFLNSLKNSFNETTAVKRRELIRSCFSCHAPYIKDASDDLVDHIAGLIIISTDIQDKAYSETAIAELSALSIDCRVCHMIKGLPEAEVKPNIIYGTGWDSNEHSHWEDYGFDTVKSDYLLSSDSCKSCHGDCPVNRSLSNPDEHTKSYTKSNADNNNKTCKDCHMRIDHSFTAY